MGKLIPKGGLQIPPVPPPPPRTSKVCSRCGLDKPLAEFNARAKSRDGRRHTCRHCDLEIKVAWREKERADREAGVRPKPNYHPKPEPEPKPEPAPVPRIHLVDNPPEAVAPAPRIREVALDEGEDEARELARQYADILNRKLPVQRRAALMVRIAKMAKGPTAALALQALRDINNATGVTEKSGKALDAGRLFLLPEGTQMRLKGA